MTEQFNTRTWLLGALWFVMLIIAVILREVLLPFLLAALLAYLLHPIVAHLNRIQLGSFRVPRSLAILTVYLILALTLCLIAVMLLPQLYEQLLKAAKIATDSAQEFDTTQIQDLVAPIDAFLQKWGIPIQIVPELSALIKAKSLNLVGGLQELIQQVFNFVLKFVLVLMLTGFILVDTDRIKRFLFRLIPSQDQNDFDALLARIDHGLSGVVRGQLTICVVNAILTSIGLFILDVKFPLVLATLAGIFSLIPIFGSIISTIPIALVAVMTSPLTAFFAIIWIIAIHALEANFLNPKIMGTAAKIHPVLIVLALVTGEHFFGLAGALLAVPIASIFLNVFSALLNKTTPSYLTGVAKG